MCAQPKRKPLDSILVSARAFDAPGCRGDAEGLLARVLERRHLFSGGEHPHARWAATICARLAPSWKFLIHMVRGLSHASGQMRCRETTAFPRCRNELWCRPSIGAGESHRRATSRSRRHHIGSSERSSGHSTAPAANRDARPASPSASAPHSPRSHRARRARGSSGTDSGTNAG